MVQVCIGDGCMEGGMTAGKMAMIVISIVLAAILTITFLYIKGTAPLSLSFPATFLPFPHAPLSVLFLGGSRRADCASCLGAPVLPQPGVAEPLR